MSNIDLKSLLAIDPAATADKICSFIKEQIKQSGAQGVVIGISGGLDSTVAASLTASAIGPDKVKGLFLPERDTAPESAAYANTAAESSGIVLETLDITSALEQIGAYKGKVPAAMKSAGINRTAFTAMRSLRRRNPFYATFDADRGTIINEATAFFRVKHRLRMAVLYHQAEREGRLVVGCLNRTEKTMGYFVHYGDDAADLAPLLQLYKTQVRALASHLQVPETIISLPPSPDLIAGITDETALGITYAEIDQILAGLEHRVNHQEIAAAVGTTTSVVDSITRHIMAIEEAIAGTVLVMGPGTSRQSGGQSEEQ